MKRSLEPTSCSGCWSFLSPLVVLTFFPLPTLLLTASVEATGKQITGEHFAIRPQKIHW